MSAPPLDDETVGVVARVAGFEIPAEDLPGLVVAFANELGGIALLDAAELGDAEPVVGFDPRWR